MILSSTQILRVMKLTAIILLAGCLQVAARGSAQNVTLSVKNANIKVVFKEIQKQTGFNILVDEALVERTPPVTIDVKNMPVITVLGICLGTQTLDYSIVDGTIVINKKPVVTFTPPPPPPPIDIKGKVVNEKGEPVAGVSVIIKGTNRGTSTNDRGEFELKGVADDAILFFTGATIQPYETKLNGRTEISVMTTTKVTDLDDIIIGKGYYNATKSLNTGSVSTVTSKEIERQPISDPILTLQGRVPGLTIRQTYGVPGRNTTIRIRGGNSLENGNDPLFIVDGVPFNSTPLNSNQSIQQSFGGTASPFNYLNPQDIEKIEILKDADATALYGSRGSNGVILITTKKGVPGKTTFSVNFYRGFGQSINRVRFMNTEEFRAMRRKAYANDGQSPGANAYDLNGAWDSTRYTDWQKFLRGGVAPVSEGTVGLSGGNERTNFRLSTTFRSEGVAFPIKLRSTRGSGSLTINHSSANNRLTIGIGTSYSYSENNLPVGGQSIEGQILLAPNAPAVYNNNGTLNWQNSTWTNPLGIYEQSAEEVANTFISTLAIGYEINEDFSFKISGGFTKVLFAQTNLRPASSVDPSLLPNPVTFRGNTILKNDQTNWITEPQITYARRFGFGKIDALVGASFQSSVGDFFNMRGSGYQSDELIKNFASATTFSGTRRGTEYKYGAVNVRIGYNLHEKYILNFTGNRNGSSRFGPNRKFGNFGSVAAAWIFSKEAWAIRAIPWMNFGKIRASLGTTGNDQIGDYSYIDLYTVNSNLYQANPGFIPGRLTNPFYGWERATKFEVGLELGALKNKIKAEISYYRNQTRDQLVQYPLPTTTGFASIVANLPAILLNSGLELNFSTINIENKSFVWKSDFNISSPKNKLVSFPGIQYSTYARKYIVGEPTSISFRYNYLGKDPTTGYFTFEDYNKDGAITTLDQQPYFIGQKYFGGFNNTFEFAPIELNFLFQFAKQNGLGYFGTGTAGTLQNQPVFKNDQAYRQPFTQSNSIISSNYSRFTSSDGAITDASYISLKNVSVSYNLPIGAKVRKAITNLNIYALGQNLFTVSRYQGFHPETPAGQVVYPLQRTITIGVKAAIN